MSVRVRKRQSVRNMKECRTSACEFAALEKTHESGEKVDFVIGVLMPGGRAHIGIDRPNDLIVERMMWYERAGCGSKSIVERVHKYDTSQIGLRGDARE